MERRIAVFMLALLWVGQALAAQPIPLGLAADGTQVFLEAPSGSDRQRVINAIRATNASKPRNAEEFVRRMKRSCMGRRSGLVQGVVGGAVAFGREFFEEIPQEYTGDVIGFGGAQLAAAPDEPGWLVHWSEQTLSGDFLAQIGIAVAAQTGITTMAAGLMSDVCNYYLSPSQNKKPFPLNPDADITDLTPEERTAVRKVYSRVRARRALVNGGAMGFGMVLGRYVIQAANDPSLRRCMADSMTKRWGQTADFTEYQRSCETAANKWFSRMSSADLNAAVISSLISGVGTYALREAGAEQIERGMRGAVRFSAHMDRNQLAKALASKALQRDLSRRAFAIGTKKTLKILVHGVRAMRSTRLGTFAFEVVLEIGTGFVVSYVDENVVRPVVTPFFEQIGYESQMNDLILRLSRATDIALSSEQKYIGLGRNPIVMPGIVMNAGPEAIEPVESVIGDIVFTNSQWREKTGYEANEIRQNWQDVVKYPENVLNSGFKVYEKLIELGSHDTLMPSPVVWDFFSNPRSPFKSHAENALKRLKHDSKELESLIYELLFLHDFTVRLQSAEGRRSLLDENLISPSFANAMAEPAAQQKLLKDQQEIMKAGSALNAARENRDFARNLREGITTLVAIVNDSSSTFAFPEIYRNPAAGRQPFLTSIADDLLANTRGSNHCGQLNSRREALVKGFYYQGKSFNTRWPFYLCDGKDRYGFAVGVYPNRIYKALNTYLGFPFKLRPRAEDIEIILKNEDGTLTAENDLELLAEVGHAYGTNMTTRTREVYHGSDGFSTVTHETRREELDPLLLGASDGPLTLRTKIDLFVNRTLCGQPFSANFFMGNDVELLKKLREGGLRVKTGLPSITIELDGRSNPWVCEMEITGQSPKMNFSSYVDYFSRDIEHLDRPSTSPERHMLTYGNSAPAAWRNGSGFISKSYSDFIDLASRRIRPEFLRNPEGFRQLWETKIEKPYRDFVNGRNYQQKYEEVIQETVGRLGIVWRLRGDTGKCSLMSVFRGQCGTTATYKPEDMIDPRVNVQAAFNWYEPGSPHALYYDRLIEPKLPAFTTFLEKPLSEFSKETGRGFYAVTYAETALTARWIWKLAKFYEQGIRAKDPSWDSSKAMNKLKRSLFRVMLMPELTWQYIDETTPTSQTVCPNGPVGCPQSRSRAAAFELVKAFLGSFTSAKDREEYKVLEAALQRGYEEVGISGSDVKIDTSVDRVILNIVQKYNITPGEPLGNLTTKVPNLFASFGRNDAFFKIAGASITISLHKELFEISRALYELRVAGKQVRFITEEMDRVNFANEKAIYAYLRSIFEGSLNQISLFDSFKSPTPDQKVQEAFAEIESVTQDIRAAFDKASNFNYTPCDRRLMLDNTYKARPDLSRSVECAASAGLIPNLTRENISAFERNFTIVIPAPAAPQPEPVEEIVVTARRRSKAK